jgi:rubredoxin
MYSYKCEHCEGTFRPKKVKREAVKHKTGFVILEDVIIGVRDLCGTRYYSEYCMPVNDIATGTRPFDKTEEIPVARLSQA